MATETTSAAELVPASLSLAKLRRAADEYRGCPLWKDATQTVFGAGPRKDATQTVFGAGPRKAELMLAGEQPGDREDVEGKRRLHQTPRAGGSRRAGPGSRQSWRQ